MIALAALAGFMSMGAPDFPLAVAYVRSFQQSDWTYDCFGNSDRLGRCIARRKIGRASVELRIAGYTADDDLKIEMTISGDCAKLTSGATIDRFTLPDSYLDPSRTLLAGSKPALTKCGAFKDGHGFDGDFTGVLSTLVALNEGDRSKLEAMRK